jgi:hypothetical protein
MKGSTVGLYFLLLRPCTRPMTCLDSMLRMLCAQVDAMSDAVDNAEVMLSCISLAYKESASKDTHLSAAVV